MRVEVFQQLAVGLVQLGEAEETAVAGAARDPTLDHRDTGLDLGLAPGFAGSCR